MKDQGRNDRVQVLGGGLTGLTAAHVLVRNGRRVSVVESAPEVGGLARTVRWGRASFDLGGHRFHTSRGDIERYVRMLMGPELLSVPRRSKILLRGKMFDYPLKPFKALASLGPATSLKVLSDYGVQKIGSLFESPPPVSLEEKVVRDFGREFFHIFFRDYSEKVWGLKCKEISADWIARRIGGLSLWTALKSAFAGGGKKNLPTLAESFLYPSRGIGRLADRLAEEVAGAGNILTGTKVVEVRHRGCEIESLVTQDSSGRRAVAVEACVSTIPLTALVRALRPRPPAEVISVSQKLRFRDLVVVALLVDRPRVTDQTWIYLPDADIPFGRIHEPKNWSGLMAPPDQTVIVAEYFCTAGDALWKTGDDRLGRLTSRHLERIGLIDGGEVRSSRVVRVPRAYPLFDIEYRKRLDTITAYLGRFGNLHLAGRNGSFSYYNMDDALGSGMEAAAQVLRRHSFPGAEDVVREERVPVPA